MGILNIIINVIGVASGIIGIVECFGRDDKKNDGNETDASNNHVRNRSKKVVGVTAIILGLVLVLTNLLVSFLAEKGITLKTEAENIWADQSQTGKKYGDSFADAKQLKGPVNPKFKLAKDAETCEHWYYIESEEDTCLALALSGASDLNLEISVYDKNRENVLAQGSGRDKIINIEIPIQKGKFYIKVVGDKNRWYKLQPENRTSSLLNDESPDNSNDTYSTAAVIESGGSESGHLGYYNDSGVCDETDYYTFTIDESAMIDISLEAEENLKSQITLTTADTDNDIGYNEGTNKQISMRYALQEGTYYIKINRLDSYGGYKLSVIESEPKYISDNEPNNRFDNAIPLNVGIPANGQIGFINDSNRYDGEDWYKVQIMYPEVNISLEPHGNTGNLNVLLMNETAGEVIGQESCSHSIASLKAENLLVPGVYYVVVQAEKGSFGCYSLEVNR